MTRRGIPALILWLGLVQPVSGSDITILLRLNPKPTTPVALTPRVRVADSELSAAAKGEERWVATIPDQGLYTSVVVTPRGALPTNYDVAALTKIVPYYNFGKNSQLLLAPTKVDQPEAARISDELFSRDVQNMGLDSLADFLQRSRVVALARIGAKGDNWAELHGRDVQSVYKFLETVVVLWKRDFVTVNDQEVAKSREWLHDAARNRAKLVRIALKFDPQAVTKVEQELLARDGVLFDRLWKRVLDEEDRTRRCTLLDHYQKALDSASDYDSIVLVTGVSRRTVLSARAQCAANQIKASTLESTQAAAQKVSAVRDQIEKELKTVAAVDGTDRDVRLLKSDLATLVGLERSPP